MKKIKTLKLDPIIDRLIEDVNNYSELVALNYQQRREGKFKDDTVVDWNRGNLNAMEDYLRELAETTGVKLVWECGVHTFGFDDWQRALEYVTVRRAWE